VGRGRGVDLPAFRHEQRARHRQREGGGTGFGEAIILVVAADAHIPVALVRRSRSGTEDQFREEESVSEKSVMNAEPDLLCTRPAGNPDSETSGPYAVNNRRRTRSPDEGAGGILPCYLPAVERGGVFTGAACITRMGERTRI